MPPADDQIPDAILDALPRFFAEEPGAAVDVEAWAERHPRHRLLLDGARRLWDAVAPGPDSADRPADEADAAWERFRARVTGRAASAAGEETPGVE